MANTAPGTEGNDLRRRSISRGFPRAPSNIDAAFVWSGNGRIYFIRGSYLKARASGVDLTGLLGDIKEDWGSGDPSRFQGRSPGKWSGDEVPQKLKLFCETTHNIWVKIQQTTVAVTRVDILNDITSKMLGDITMDVPLHKYWGGHVPSVP